LNILITGGIGFIASHTYIALRTRFPNARLVIVDNLTNSKIQTLNSLTEVTGDSIIFHHLDLCNEQAVENLFNRYHFYGILHFAGYKAVEESVMNPLKYYMNNIQTTLNLVKYCLQHKIERFIFSSSATVYGKGKSPLKESDPTLPPSSPYGQTKAICERILLDVANANPWLGVSLLRYFNPIGAHESGLIGETPANVPNNLMPYITKVAKGDLPVLNIFGGDYPTLDGTAIRDYIHVLDIAEGHVAALEHVRPGVHIYNLGTGKGTSVLQLVKAFEQANGVKVPYRIVDRRPGDLASVYADVQKAESELQWKARRTIEDMCKDAWNFEKNNILI
jgi:UDP-glucose 4-epimerase